MTPRTTANIAILVGAAFIVGAAAARSGLMMWILLGAGVCVWLAVGAAFVGERRGEASSPAVITQTRIQQPRPPAIRMDRRVAVPGLLILSGLASAAIALTVALSPVELDNDVPCGSYFSADPGATRAASLVQANQRYEALRGVVPLNALVAEDYRDEALNLADCSDARGSRGAPVWGLIAAGIVLCIGGAAAFAYWRLER